MTDNAKISEVQKRMDALPAAMSAKGLRLPNTTFWLEANSDARLYLKWNAGAGDLYSDEKREWFRGKTASEMLDAAEAYIDALPSAEETKRNTFLAALGKVIDLGNEFGQDVGALASEMKRLASNALTDQRSIEPAE